MSYGVAVKTKDSAGEKHLAGGQTFFKVEGQIVVVKGDAVTPHGSGPHAAPTMTQGSSWLKLNGKPACRQGHPASCGHTSTGRAWFRLPN